MKEIRINSVMAPDPESPYLNNRLYKVYLGNGHKADFQSFAKAKAFLARCNRFLNMQLHQINDLYGQVFMIYRQNWFYLDKDPGMDKWILSEMDQINHRLKLAIDRSGFTNGNTFVFNYLTGSCRSLEEICKALADLQYAKSNMPEYWRITGISNQIFRIRMDIENYGSVL